MSERWKLSKRSVSLIFLNDDEPDPRMMTDVWQRVREVQSPENQKIIDGMIKNYTEKQKTQPAQEEPSPTFSERLKNILSNIRANK